MLTLPTVRGLSRAQAAAFFGVCVTTFTEMVKDGRASKPRAINSRRVWDLHELDEAFDALPA